MVLPLTATSVSVFIFIRHFGTVTKKILLFMPGRNRFYKQKNCILRLRI